MKTIKNKQTTLIFSTLLALVILLSGCKKGQEKFNDLSKDNEESSIANTNNNMPKIESLIENLKDSQNNEIIVVAHRGDWRNAPENSLQAIQNCIDFKVDMVEIDVRETKDGQLVVIHDQTLDRTTNGKGLVKDWTLDSLKTLYLKDGLGQTTPHKIPTLKEALELSKDKILINLDKSYNIFDKCFEIIKETGTQDQVIIKGAKSKQVVEREFGQYLDKVLFMPVIKLPYPDVDKLIKEYMDAENPPVAFEFVFKNDSVSQISKFDDYRDSGISVWVNSLWSHLSGGHDDEKAAINIDTYQWYIDNNIDIIQTDRPELLIKYLRSKGLHN